MPRMVFTSTILIELCDTKAIDVKHPMQGMDDKKNHKQNRRYIESKVSNDKSGGVEMQD